MFEKDFLGYLWDLFLMDGKTYSWHQCIAFIKISVALKAAKSLIYIAYFGKEEKTTVLFQTVCL